MVTHTFNPKAQEAEAGRSIWVQGQPGLQIEFQDSQEQAVKETIESRKLVIIYWDKGGMFQLQQTEALRSFRFMVVALESRIQEHSYVISLHC